MSTILLIHGVHKYFTRAASRSTCSTNLHLEVEAGEFLGIMGPSRFRQERRSSTSSPGSIGPARVKSGSAKFPISAMSEADLARWRTRHIGFIFQFYHLLPVLTAYENVELPLFAAAAVRPRTPEASGDGAGAGRAVRFARAIGPGQLSGGQQQRVGIARAIVTDPILIVADEPTGDLDARSADEILNLMCELQQGLAKTILLVTHDPKAAARAQRIVHLEKGRLIEASQV